MTDAVGSAASNPATLSVLAPPPQPSLRLDAPSDGGVVAVSFTVAGWAIDRGAVSGTGVDAIHVYAYPNPGSSATPVFLGEATYGARRPDVGAAFGGQFTNAGFTLSVTNLAAGRYQIVAFGRSTVAGTFNMSGVATISVGASLPITVLDSPTPNSRLGRNLVIEGWAIDQRRKPDRLAYNLRMADVDRQPQA